MRLLLMGLALALAPLPARAQDVAAGRQTFETRCGRCHGGDGNGAEMGPSIIQRLKTKDDAQLADADSRRHPRARDAAQRRRRRRAGRSRPLPAHNRARPGSRGGAAELRPDRRRHDRRRRCSARASTTCRSARPTAVCTCCGGRASASARSRPKPAWPAYNGDPGGNRYTALTQIDKTNVARLAPKWMFTLPNAGGLQVTPVVADGIMYVTAPNEMLCARCRQRTPDLALPASAHGRSRHRRGPTAASRSRAIASSWKPTTRTASR